MGKRVLQMIMIIITAARMLERLWINPMLSVSLHVCLCQLTEHCKACRLWWFISSYKYIARGGYISRGCQSGCLETPEMVFFFYRYTDKDTQFKSMQTRESHSLNPGNFLITFKHTDANTTMQSMSLLRTLLLFWLLLVLFMLGYYTITISKHRISLTALVPNMCV